MGLIDRIGNRPNLKLIDPVGYLDMLALNRFARVILTDSGGIQEEATVLGVACVTLRHNTERPVTVEVGANRVVGNEPKKIREALSLILGRNGHQIRVPEFWDGKAAERIVTVIDRLFS